jgi:Tol biopolymer transport system component
MVYLLRAVNFTWTLGKSIYGKLPIAGYRFALLLALTTGLVSCSRLPDITSETIRKISSQRFANIDWAPDGSTIFAVGARYLPAPLADLFSIEVATGKSTKLTEVSGVYGFASWSSDGEKIALTVDQNTIWIFDVSTRSSTYLTAGEGAVWLPDGDKLAIYVGPLPDADTDHREIRIVDLQGDVLDTLEVGAVIPELLQLKPYLVRPDEDLSGLDISPDGDNIIFSLDLYKGKLEGEDRGEERQEAYLVNLRDESVLPFLPGEPVGFISWSPDGTKIAYIRPEILDVGELVIADNEGRCLFIPDLPHEISSPSWAPDSSKLAFLYGGAIHILDLSPQSTQQGNGCP